LKPRPCGSYAIHRVLTVLKALSTITPDCVQIIRGFVPGFFVAGVAYAGIRMV